MRCNGQVFRCTQLYILHNEKYELQALLKINVVALLSKELWPYKTEFRNNAFMQNLFICFHPKMGEWD